MTVGQLRSGVNTPFLVPLAAVDEPPFAGGQAVKPVNNGGSLPVEVDWQSGVFLVAAISDSGRGARCGFLDGRSAIGSNAACRMSLNIDQHKGPPHALRL